MGYPPAPTPIPAYLFARAVVWTGADPIAVETSPAIALAYDGNEILGVSANVQGAPSGDTTDFDVSIGGASLGPFSIADGDTYMSEAIGSGSVAAGDEIVFDLLDDGGATGPIVIAVYFRLGGVTFLT
jgi:hypothetical protein